MEAKPNPNSIDCRIKVCGITSVADAVAAAEAGVDAIGLVFYPASPRYVSLRQASEIVAGLPPFVSVVALFVDADVNSVKEVLAALPIGLLQFHGGETPDYCAQFGRPYLKAFRVRPETDVIGITSPYPGAAGFLLDTYKKGVPGGTGECFDWNLIPSHLHRPVILAGGLNPDNIVAAIHQVRPFAVDVSGGVEASAGVKDHDKLKAFVDLVRQLRC